MMLLIGYIIFLGFEVLARTSEVFSEREAVQLKRAGLRTKNFLREVK